MFLTKMPARTQGPDSYPSLAEVLYANFHINNSAAARIACTMRMEEAAALLRRLMDEEARNYLEWGSGGSTEMISFLMLNTTLRNRFRAFSVESSVDWMRSLRSKSPTIVGAEERGMLTYHHGNIGPTGHLGFPKEQVNASRALNYVRPFGSSHQRMDLVLVDGRFRVACALQALHYMHNKSVLLMHDYGPEAFGATSAQWAVARRNEYGSVERFYERTILTHTLSAFRPRMPIDRPALHVAFQRALNSAV